MSAFEDQIAQFVRKRKPFVVQASFRPGSAKSQRQALVALSDEAQKLRRAGWTWRTEIDASRGICSLHLKPADRSKASALVAGFAGAIILGSLSHAFRR